ncbi:unnamed protein product [Paramecium sonneborni]|uniref:Uncharacterized protein n=1 Tax=Paramecium sonneborni TaxID=65129 RepID=A0A8S1RTZ4_9CILI|nr:unnamed protein product [Paramecium sonneborni]
MNKKCSCDNGTGYESTSCVVGFNCIVVPQIYVYVQSDTFKLVIMLFVTNVITLVKCVRIQQQNAIFLKLLVILVFVNMTNYRYRKSCTSPCEQCYTYTNRKKCKTCLAGLNRHLFNFSFKIQ